MDDMRDSNFELCNMAVKDLTLRQLQSLQVRTKSKFTLTLVSYFFLSFDSWIDHLNICLPGSFQLSLISSTSQTYHSSVEEFGSRDWRTDPTAANSDEPEDLLPFPMLEKLLTTLDVHVGVNVEIKYPQFIDVREYVRWSLQIHISNPKFPLSCGYNISLMIIQSLWNFHLHALTIPFL